MAKRSSSFGTGVTEADKKKVTKEGFKKALKIFRFTLPYKGTFAIGFIFLVLSQITSMSVPLLMGQMVGAIVSPKKLSSAVQTPRSTTIGRSWEASRPSVRRRSDILNVKRAQKF
jgi:hypothetical protein